MARQIQTPDAMVESGEIRNGTALFRVHRIVNDQPLDQESSEFLVGDIRDVCRVCDEKEFTDIRGKIKGKSIGEVVMLPVADVRQLVAAALNPDGHAGDTLKTRMLPKPTK